MTRKLEQSQYLVKILRPCEDSNLTEVPFCDRIFYHTRNYLNQTWLVDENLWILWPERLEWTLKYTYVSNFELGCRTKTLMFNRSSKQTKFLFLLLILP